jgi:hypothetical protein
MDHFGYGRGNDAVSCRGKESVPLPKPYTFTIPFFREGARSGGRGDSLESPTRSPFILCEDGRPLGPAHTRPEDVLALGQGRYVHWGGVLFFSTPDNSDPNSNNRNYELKRE